MNSATNTSHRQDDAAPARTAREVPCCYCNGLGVIVSRYANTLDPGAVREFRQKCVTCGGSDKAAADGGQE